MKEQNKTTKNNKHSQNYFEQREENLMEWVGYWRKNPHLFVRDYLGIKLFLYQKILIYMMAKYDKFMYIAARGRTWPSSSGMMIIITPRLSWKPKSKDMVIRV